MGIEEVVVTIAKDGSVQVATNGFTGLSCTSATAGLERMLGNEVLERTMTDEAYLEQGNSGGLVQEAGGQAGTGASW